MQQVSFHLKTVNTFLPVKKFNLSVRGNFQFSHFFSFSFIFFFPQDPPNRWRNILKVKAIKAKCMFWGRKSPWCYSVRSVTIPTVSRAVVSAVTGYSSCLAPGRPISRSSLGEHPVLLGELGFLSLVPLGAGLHPQTESLPYWSLRKRYLSFLASQSAFWRAFGKVQPCC